VTHPSSPRPSAVVSVLIVDDDADTRGMYACALAGAGFRVFQARNGADAVACAFEALPDVIVTDLSMPQTDGFELLALVQRDRRTRQIPVIVLSGWTDAHLSGLARDAGAAAFLRKPCAPDCLLLEISRALAPNAPGQGDVATA
jgi:two-component system cell cycle response regulator DivK